MKIYYKLISVLFLVILLFSFSFASERHWVGSTGVDSIVWSNPQNWSTIQNGVGGAGVPTDTDDVFIDGGLTSLVINQVAVCKSLNQSVSLHSTTFATGQILIVGSGGISLSAGTIDGTNAIAISDSGNWSITGGTFISGEGQIMLNGSNPQLISGALRFNRLQINNVSGVAINSDIIIDSALTFINGIITTGTNRVIIGTTGSVIGAGPGGHVYGYIKKLFLPGKQSYRFDIGGPQYYRPLEISFDSIITAGGVTAKSTRGENPYISSSAIDSAKDVNQYWITWADTGMQFTSYDATFHFIPTDIDAGANPNNFIIQKWNVNKWTSPLVGNRTDTSTQAIGLMSFSEFAIGEIKTFSLSATATSGGVISPSGGFVLEYGASKSFDFYPDPTYHLTDLLVDGIHVDSTTSYTFNNITSNHTIHAVFSNSYKISATATTGGSINPSGDIYVINNSNQAFTILPDTGYLLEGLFVDGIHVDSTTSYTFTNVTTNHTIHAVFSIKQFTISATSSNGGTINPTGNVVVDYGTNKNFTITPNTGYHFVELFVDAVHSDSTTSYTFYNVTDNHTIHAVFGINQFTILAGAGEGGSISPSGLQTLNYGEGKQFVITPNTGYNLDSLFVDGVHVDSTTSYTFRNVTANHTIYAKFVIQHFTITASAGTGGTINPSGAIAVNYGEDKSFRIAANSGYSIDTLFVDGIHVDSTTSYTFHNITANHTIYAKFVTNKLTITASASGGGTINPTGNVVVDYGTNKNFTFTPNTGYHFVELFVDAVHSDSTTSYTFYNVTDNHTIHAVFGINQFTILAGAGEGGSISPSGLQTLNYGEGKQFVITPNTGYNLDSLFVDGVHVDSTTSYTFRNVTANHTIYAKFVIQHFTITASAGTGGTISPSGSIQVNYGDSLRFTMAPQSGYVVDSIFVDGVYVSTDTTYTIENITSNHTIHVTFISGDGVKDKQSQIPKVYALHQNYPNPFNPTTMIQIDLPQRSVVTLNVYNILGAEVMTLIDNKMMDAGIKEIEFNSENLASGIYLYRITAEGTNGKNFVSVKRMILLK